MSSAILATKLFLPPPRPKAVLRLRLTERLSHGLAAHRRLTLISAPAGFGKTTLVGEWAAGLGRPTAWLSLDEGDNDPFRFLTYVVAALRTVAAGLGEAELAVLQSPQPAPVESILTALLNQLAALPEPLILVLDDYHVIEAQAVHAALGYLLDHLPPQLQVVLTTREDPQLPLARYRARGQLTELRAADLRFTADEAAEFLSQVMGLRFAAADLAALETRTEGWIAGLQLAALSMQGHQDVAGFIRSFAGDHRYVVDYLVEEVLQRQPEPVRRFLLQTAILDRLSGPLCEAVTGQADAGARLEALERGNFFVVPLDDRRQWYRYHHLFADVLRAHAKAEQPDQFATLHLRASAWYERQGSAAEAIRHALAAADFARAAGLIELAMPPMRRNRQEALLLSWLRALPAELFHNRPILSGLYAAVLLQNGELDGVEAHLAAAEQWLARPDSAAERIVMDEAEWRRLPGWIAVHRAGLALARDDVAGTLRHARQALELVTESDHLGRGSAAALLGLAAWRNGDLEAAQRGYVESMAHLQQAEHYADLLGCALALADMQLAQGHPLEARQTYERALRLAPDLGLPTLRGTADMVVGLSELYCERNALEAAAEYLQRGQDLGEHMGLPQNPYRRRVARARLQAAQGDLDTALTLLDEAERRYTGDFSPNVRPIAALKARLWVAQGRLAEAHGWVRAQGLSPDDDLSYLSEFEHFTLARVLLAQARADRDDHVLGAAQRLLEGLQQAAAAGGRDGSVMEALLLQALVHHARGDLASATVPLERALRLAEPKGYVRLFLDEGAPLAQLLRAAAARSRLPGLAGRLLEAFDPEPSSSVGASAGPSARAAPQLIEPLSQRELEVLRLFRADLSGPEIACELVIALSTLRTHTKHIYSKLDVNSRRAAVNRAIELGLL
ncbi:MAG: AAA family ATPase [Ardenticatenia bacterium]|nr:AAA family ATPase [Ardenticatenia bacterium]